MAASGEEELKDSLKRAVCGNDLEKTGELFARAAALFQDPAAGITPAVMATALLRFAAECNAPDTARFLIAQGADVNAHLKTPAGQGSGKGSFLQHALYYAAENSAKALIEAGADLGARDDEGSTPLHYALTYCRSPEVIYLLMRKGADFHVKNGNGETPNDLLAEDPMFKECLDSYLRAQTHFKRLKQRRPPPPFRKKP